MSLRAHLQLLTPVWHNLSMFWGRMTCVWLFVSTGQYLVRRKWNRKLNRKRKRTRNRKRERNHQSTSIYATLAWAHVYVCLYALSSPSVCPYTSWTYGVSLTSQHRAGVDTGVSQPPPPHGSTLAIPLTKIGAANIMALMTLHRGG